MMQSVLNPGLIAACAKVRVIPVLTIADARLAVPLARALATGGLTVLEITLRTDAALEAIRRIAAEVEGVIVGAGTVLDAQHAAAAIQAGSQFLVSPGATPRLFDAAEHWEVPLLPGAATASEAMVAFERGYRFLKFFPAEQSGGISALKALGAPLADVKFCPTGGVGAGNMAAYLACSNVVCVGGSWVAPAKLIDGGDWAGIELLARNVRDVRPGSSGTRL